MVMLATPSGAIYTNITQSTTRTAVSGLGCLAVLLLHDELVQVGEHARDHIGVWSAEPRAGASASSGARA